VSLIRWWVAQWGMGFPACGTGKHLLLVGVHPTGALPVGHTATMAVPLCEAAYVPWNDVKRTILETQARKLRSTMHDRVL
jgi:hypothetical protein